MTRFWLTRSKFNLSWTKSFKIMNKNYVKIHFHVECLWNFATVFKSHLIPKGMGHKIHLKQTPKGIRNWPETNLMYCTFLCQKDVWLFEFYFNFEGLCRCIILPLFFQISKHEIRCRVTESLATRTRFSSQIYFKFFFKFLNLFCIPSTVPPPSSPLPTPTSHPNPTPQRGWGIPWGVSKAYHIKLSLDQSPPCCIKAEHTIPP